VDTTYQYDALDRLTRLKYVKGTTTLEDFQYQFNDVNSITQLTDGAGGHNYTYDTLNRLTAATHPSQTNESYTFDDVGNRTASHQGSSYSYQTFNRLVAANSNDYGYDTNGNLISKIDASGSWSYTWDYENRLKQAACSGGVTVNYAFDALGRRIQRSSSAGATTKFVYDGADVVRDLNADLTVAVDYLNGPDIDNKLQQTAGGIASYFVTDHLGTTRALTDASGNVTSSLSYDSFGNVISGSTSTRYTYTGRETDFDTGLMYYRARWYDPRPSRFLSEDPIDLAGGINLYAYVLNNPVKFKDPQGLKVWVCSRLTHAPEDWVGANHSYLYDDRNNESCGLSGPRMSFYPFYGSTAKEKGPNDGGTCRLVDGTDDPAKADKIMNCCKNYKGKSYIPGYSDCHNLTHSCIAATGLKDPGAPGGRFGDRCIKCK